MCKKKVSGKVKEVKDLKTFYCVEKMPKNFTLQDDEKFCVFVTKDKRQAIILTLSIYRLQQKQFGISYS